MLKDTSQSLLENCSSTAILCVFIMYCYIWRQLIGFLLFYMEVFKSSHYYYVSADHIPPTFDAALHI